MNIAITGGNGFIGSAFLNLYRDRFDNVLQLTSGKTSIGKRYELNDLNSIINQTKGVDCFIHCAFDHNYRDNIIGIRNIIEACKVNKIEKLIYLSTVSVYDPMLTGEVDESRQYSALYDPYSYEKVKIEKIIRKSELNNVTILQPSIVYGLGGNWTKYAFNLSRSGGVELSATNKCNPVYVNDVAQAIYRSTQVNSNKINTFLISADSPVSWQTFYEKHDQIMSRIANWNSSLVIQNTNSNKYHNSFFGNFVLNVWFNTPVGLVLNKLVAVIKKIRAKKYVNVSNKEDIKQIFSEARKNIIESPVGITRLVHNCQFEIEINKAKSELHFQPEYSFDSGMSLIEDKLIND